MIIGFLRGGNWEQVICVEDENFRTPKVLKLVFERGQLNKFIVEERQRAIKEERNKILRQGVNILMQIINLALSQWYDFLNYFSFLSKI